MNDTMHSSSAILAALVVLVVALTLSLVLVAATVAAPSGGGSVSVVAVSAPVAAVPGTSLNGPFGGPGRGFTGRGRVPASPADPAPAGASWIIGGVLAALVVGGTAVYAAVSSQGSRVGGASVASIGGQAGSEESRRKAA